mmetsp:Transcript_18801/g.56360  ORF Transcript_18801/g.56360 Transcript_18801/m.56360 type:complete len:340 (-) Transcript_18801:659-1678(-)
MTKRPLALLITVVVLSVTVCAFQRADYEVAVISDLHIGESGDTARDNLNAVVNRINEWASDAQHSLRFVVVTGDLTNTALPSQWEEVRAALDRLVVPYLPTLGNHDVWSYNGTWEEAHPTGDRLFAQTFADVFVDWQQNTSGDPLLQSFEYWGDSVVHDPDLDIQCQFQNWKLQYGGLVMFGLDWNTRVAAATRLGYQGSMPTAALHDFANGTFPWIRSQLVKLNGTAPPEYLPQVLLLHHHPYRTPLPIPGFVYDFGPEHKHQLEEMFRSSLVNSAYWGSIAGHFHIWQNTTAFDDWPTFRQWDTKACKVDAAISLVTIQDGRIISLSREYGRTPTVL